VLIIAGGIVIAGFAFYALPTLFWSCVLIVLKIAEVKKQPVLCAEFSDDRKERSWPI
jgi:hypothetical protein